MRDIKGLLFRTSKRWFYDMRKKKQEGAGAWKACITCETLYDMWNPYYDSRNGQCAGCLLYCVMELLEHENTMSFSSRKDS